MPDKGTLREEGFALTHSLRIQSIRVEVSGEHEAAGHISVVIKQGVMKLVLSSLAPFYLLQDHSMMLSRVKVNSPT